MTTISVEELQRDVAGYLRLIEAGETLVVTQAGEPVAEIKPIMQEPSDLRPYALAAGDFQAPADFDEPLPDDVLQLFEQ